MGELYQLQASSPVTSRVHQTYSAITSATRVTALIDSPVRDLFPLYRISCDFVSIASDEIHRKSEKEMTEAELKQTEVDRAYFHSHRDKTKDGMLDKVNSIYLLNILEMLCYQRHT